VQVFSDHQNLEYFTTTKVLNRRQARWVQELAGIDFCIYYRPGTKNGKPDALSRRSEYRPEKGGVENQPITTVLQKNHFAEPEKQGRSFICSSVQRASLPSGKWWEEFATMVREKGQDDEEYQRAWKQVQQEAAQEEPVADGRKAQEVAGGPREVTRRSRKARTEGILEIKEGLLYRKGMLWIPEDEPLKRTILESEQDSKVVGHMGQDRTIELVRRNFLWPTMEERIIEFVQSCPECQRNKATRHQPYGRSSPLELPYAP